MYILGALHVASLDTEIEKDHITTSTLIGYILYRHLK